MYSSFRCRRGGHLFRRTNTNINDFKATNNSYYNNYDHKNDIVIKLNGFDTITEYDDNNSNDIDHNTTDNNNSYYYSDINNDYNNFYDNITDYFYGNINPYFSDYDYNLNYACSSYYYDY